MSDLLKAMVAKPQRESAGSDSAARFDFQKNWAFCELIERHLTGSDYMVAFEFHDDVVFFDQEATPTAAEFFQVKTSGSAKPRQTGSLIARKGTSPSILGKMCLNFEGIANTLNLSVCLVSNTEFIFGSADTVLSAVEEKHRKKLAAGLKTEMPALSDVRIASIKFRVFHMAVDKIDGYLKGRAHDLFAARFGANFTHNVSGWIQLVQAEVTRKNNFLSTDVKDVATLLSKKCVGRSFIISTLDVVEKNSQRQLDVQLILDHLKDSGWSIGECTKFSRIIPTTVSDLSDPTDLQCRELTVEIEKQMAGKNLMTTPLATLIADVSAHLQTVTLPNGPYTDKIYQAALITLVWNERL